MPVTFKGRPWRISMFHINLMGKIVFLKPIDENTLLWGIERSTKKYVLSFFDRHTRSNVIQTKS